MSLRFLKFVCADKTKFARFHWLITYNDRYFEIFTRFTGSMLKRFGFFSTIIQFNCELWRKLSKKYDRKKRKCKYNLSKLMQRRSFVCSFVYSFFFFASYAHYKLDNKLLISANRKSQVRAVKHEIRKQKKNEKIKSKSHANTQRLKILNRKRKI